MSPEWAGLSPFGHDVVRECNRLGVMVDLSHVAATTMHAALDTSTAPAFFSHSSARAVTDHPRNVPDDVLRRVRETNGIVMVTFVPGFVNTECSAWMWQMMAAMTDLYGSDPSDRAAFRERYAAWLHDHPIPPSSVTDVADHVEHVRDVAGIDAVGLGGDFDGTGELPSGLGDVSTYPTLLAELARRGWSDADLGKLTWHNALRVLRETERIATSSPALDPSSL